MFGRLTAITLIRAKPAVANASGSGTSLAETDVTVGVRKAGLNAKPIDVQLPYHRYLGVAERLWHIRMRRLEKRGGKIYFKQIHVDPSRANVEVHCWKVEIVITRDIAPSPSPGPLVANSLPSYTPSSPADPETVRRADVSPAGQMVRTGWEVSGGSFAASQVSSNPRVAFSRGLSPNSDPNIRVNSRPQARGTEQLSEHACCHSRWLTARKCNF